MHVRLSVVARPRSLREPAEAGGWRLLLSLRLLVVAVLEARSRLELLLRLLVERRRLSELRQHNPVRS